MNRVDLIAIEAAKHGDIQGLKKIIDDIRVNQHDVFTTAVKTNNDRVVEWMLGDIMTQQCYPLGRLDIAVVADIIVKYGSQAHLNMLCGISRGHVSSLLRPKSISEAQTRGLNLAYSVEK
jgi:hypothetical protein